MGQMLHVNGDYVICAYLLLHACYVCIHRSQLNVAYIRLFVYCSLNINYFIALQITLI